MAMHGVMHAADLEKPVPPMSGWPGSAKLLTMDLQMTCAVWVCCDPATGRALETHALGPLAGVAKGTRDFLCRWRVGVLGAGMMSSEFTVMIFAGYEHPPALGLAGTLCNI